MTTTATASSQRTCFQKLGIPTGSSEKEIKKAYRKLALETHPDKFTCPQKKEWAAMAFRELYEAYEEALECSSSSSSSSNKNGDGLDDTNNDNTNDWSSQDEPAAAAGGHSNKSGRARRTSWQQRRRWTNNNTDDDNNSSNEYDSHIRQVFRDVCKELEKERERKTRMEFQRAVDAVQEAWPDEAKCWEVAKQHLAYSFGSIEKLAEELFCSNPSLSEFLKRQCEREDALDRETLERRVKELALWVDREWPKQREGIKEQAKRDWYLLDDVACLVRDKEAASALLEWLREENDDTHRRHRRRVQDAADYIIQVYPDKDKITSCLEGHMSYAYSEIFELLPEEMRSAVQATLCLVGHQDASTDATKTRGCEPSEYVSTDTEESKPDEYEDPCDDGPPTKRRKVSRHNEEGSEWMNNFATRVAEKKRKINKRKYGS